MSACQLAIESVVAWLRSVAWLWLFRSSISDSMLHWMDTMEFANLNFNQLSHFEFSGWNPFEGGGGGLFCSISRPEGKLLARHWSAQCAALPTNGAINYPESRTNMKNTDLDKMKKKDIHENPFKCFPISNPFLSLFMSKLIEFRLSTITIFTIPVPPESCWF